MVWRVEGLEAVGAPSQIVECVVIQVELEGPLALHGGSYRGHVVHDRGCEVLLRGLGDPSANSKELDTSHKILIINALVCTKKIFFSTEN